MQTPEDDFPFTSEDPSLAPDETENAVLSLPSQQLGDLKATLRLVAGSVLSVNDAYIHHLRQLQAARAPVTPATILVDENETAQDQLRYLLLGILFDTPDLIQKGMGTAERVLSKTFGLFSSMLSPVTKSRIFSPVRNRYDQAAARGEEVIDRLIMKGRVEEQNSRAVLEQKNIDSLVNEFLEYLVLKTNILEVIQEEGVDMAGDVVDEFRERSATVDTKMEQALKSFFRKRPPAKPDTKSDNSPKGG
jgi:polyhydroxyalkanoate synthesis regulator phasin